MPPGLAVNPHQGPVRADQAGATQAAKDAGDIGIEARLAATERRDQRALADEQPIQFLHQPAEPPVTDRMHEAFPGILPDRVKACRRECRRDVEQDHYYSITIIIFCLKQAR